MWVGGRTGWGYWVWGGVGLICGWEAGLGGVIGVWGGVGLICGREAGLGGVTGVWGGVGLICGWEVGQWGDGMGQSCGDQQGYLWVGNGGRAGVI